MRRQALTSSGTIKKSLILPGKRDSLARIRWILSSLANEFGLTQDDQDKLIIAVDEACSNIFEHAYGETSDAPPLEIEIEFDGDIVKVELIDTGKPFDFSAYTMPKFPEHYMAGNERGAGIYLIHQCVDHVEYDQLPDNRNRVVMMKRRNAANATKVFVPES